MYKTNIYSVYIYCIYIYKEELTECTLVAGIPIQTKRQTETERKADKQTERPTHK